MDEKFRAMLQLDSFCYFEKYLVGGGVVLLTYVLFVAVLYNSVGDML